MKKTLIGSILFLMVINLSSFSQEKYGKTLNLGAGFGYYGYIGHAVPIVNLNLEFDVVRNLTLAPFIGLYTYRNDYYWGNYYTMYRNYSYHETVIPVGIKGSYYFDELFRAGTDWDFYAGTDVGFRIKSVKWDTGYYGDKTIASSTSNLFIDIHVGSEFHMNQKFGFFLDLSTGVSTVGFSVHL